MHVSGVMEGICASSARVLFIERNPEFAFANSAVRIRAVCETTLVGLLLGIAFTAVGGNGLDPECEARLLGVVEAVDVVERMLADVLRHLRRGESMEGIELAMFSVLKELVTSLGVHRAPRSRSRPKRLVEFCRVEVSDVCRALVSCFLHRCDSS